MPINNKDILEVVQKSFDTGDLVTGGRLDPERQRMFMDLIRGDSSLIGAMRFIAMSRQQYQIDKRYFSEPITQPAEENTADYTAPSIPHSKVLLSVRKLRSFLPLTQEYLQENIEMDNVEGSIMKAVSQRVAYDIELAVIHGDTSIPATVTDPRQKLYRAIDGLDKQTQEAHIVDAAGSAISKEHFLAMKKRLPKEYKTGPMSRRLRWIMSEDVKDEWLVLLGERSTALGDNSIMQKEVPPILGIPVLVVPSIPNDKPLQLTSGLPAEIVGLRQGPFQFGSNNNKLIISINGGANRTITFPQPSALDASSVAKLINDAFAAGGDKAVAFSDSEGRIIIRTLEVGVAKTISIQTGTTAHLVLGLTSTLPYLVTGSDPASAGQIREGSFIWLTDPRNFAFGMYKNDIRIISRYNPEYDRLEMFIYTQIDTKVIDMNGVVKLVNLRVSAA